MHEPFIIILIMISLIFGTGYLTGDSNNDIYKGEISFLKEKIKDKDKIIQALMGEYEKEHTNDNIIIEGEGYVCYN